jgi:hypothetical protein
MDTYTTIGSPLDDHGGTVLVFLVDQKEVQYLLFWITKLPMDNTKSKYQIAVNEIKVNAP